MQPLLLDLFCGAGGATHGYQRAGFRVVGIDHEPQPNYCGDAFLQDDAMDIELDGFDAIHASPPCQAFTDYQRNGKVGEYPDLVDQTRQRLAGTGKPYVIENVRGAPLVHPTRYCGSSFRLDVRRHRFFESNVALVAPPCDHKWQTPRFPSASNRTNLRSTVEVGVWRIPVETQREAMDIDWMTIPELSQAIPPAYTHHIGRQLLEHVEVGE